MLSFLLITVEEEEEDEDEQRVSQTDSFIIKSDAEQLHVRLSRGRFGHEALHALYLLHLPLLSLLWLLSDDLPMRSDTKRESVEECKRREQEKKKQKTKMQDGVGRRGEEKEAARKKADSGGR